MPVFGFSFFSVIAILNAMSQYACLDDLQVWLDDYLNFERNPKKNIFWLDTMQYLCSLFDEPQKSAPAFHIAGSKGKGSVSAMIASILDAAGYKSGLYTSPHILDFVERIGSAHGPFAEDVYKKAADELRKKISGLSADSLPGGRAITWFELVTLYAFLCFREAKSDYMVLETGLGGRLDATNVVLPKVTCITPIELEHREFLGNTIEEIAGEKAGIIKEGVPLVVSRQKAEARSVFETVAKKKNAEICFIDEVTQIQSCFSFENDSKKSAIMKTVISSTLFRRPIHADLRLLGAFQAENAALAAVAVKTAIPDLDETFIEKGLEKALLPGRFEVISLKKTQKCEKNESQKRPFVILDGAHTVNSVTFTLETFRSLFGESDAHLLFACAADKDMKDIAPLFSKGFSRITLTKPGAVKESNLTALTEAFDEAGLKYICREDFVAAIHEALDNAEKAGIPLLVTGSFYLLAEVKKILQEYQA